MEQGILTGPAIIKAIEKEEIKITPFDIQKNLDRVNPASVDLTLGNEIAVYRDCTNSDFECRDFDPNTGTSGIPGEQMWVDAGYLDSSKKNGISKYSMDDRGFMLKPGIGYLMHTQECVWTNKYVPIIDGKSSIGRLFCVVHETAGYGDTYFNGQYTLEVVVVHPLVVYPGMKICQMRFHTTIGEVVDYTKNGNYVGDSARGPVASKSWKMFRS